MADPDEDDRAPRPPPETLRALDEQLTPELVKKARRYAEQRVQLVREARRPVPKNYAHELIHDAHADTWSGTAEWVPQRCTLLVHLCGVIKQRTWAEARHERRAQPISLDAPPGDGADADALTNELEHALVATCGDVGPIVFAAFVKRVCGELRRFAHIDRDGLALLSCWERDLIDRAEVMEITGLDIAAYERARKRLLYQSRELPLELRKAVQHVLRRAS